MKQVPRIPSEKGKSLFFRNNIVDRVEKLLQHIVQSMPAESAIRRVSRTTDEVGDRVHHLPVRRQLLSLLPAALTILALGACASHEYMGISLKPSVMAPELRDLAQRASGGNKQAQLELGIRYEEGQGLPVDLERARKLYTMAASDNGGTMWIYSPPVRNGAKGRVVPIDRGIMQPGLIEARQRLDALTRRASDLKVPQ